LSCSPTWARCFDMLEQCVRCWNNAFHVGKLRCHVDKKKGRRGPFSWIFSGLACFLNCAFLVWFASWSWRVGFIWCGPRAS
jgi:hypothetical protein